MSDMEQDFLDGVMQILAGVLFLTPLRAMFRRIMGKLGRKKGESFWEYNFPFLYKHLKRRKT